MTTLRLASLLFGLAMACTLMLCGAAIAYVAHWVPGVAWCAALAFFLAMWSVSR